VIFDERHCCFDFAAVLFHFRHAATPFFQFRVPPPPSSAVAALPFLRYAPPRPVPVYDLLVFRAADGAAAAYASLV